MIDNLVVSGDSLVGSAIRKRLDCSATTRRRMNDPRGYNPEFFYFNLKSNTFLPEAKITYFCSGINGFMQCENNANEAHAINVKGTVLAASEQVRRGHRVVLLSSCAAETHANTIYGDFKFLTEQRFLQEFGDQASIFRFGPVKFEGRICYPNGMFHPLTVDEVVDAVTVPFEPGLHRIFNAYRAEHAA